MLMLDVEIMISSFFAPSPLQLNLVILLVSFGNEGYLTLFSLVKCYHRGWLFSSCHADDRSAYLIASPSPSAEEETMVGKALESPGQSSAHLVWRNETETGTTHLQSSGVCPPPRDLLLLSPNQLLYPLLFFCFGHLVSCHSLNIPATFCPQSLCLLESPKSGVVHSLSFLRSLLKWYLIRDIVPESLYV